MSVSLAKLTARLDVMARRGERLSLWWRDDDAVAPTLALDRLLRLGAAHAVPCLLAVIPQGATPALAERLRDVSLVQVGVHGWAHLNHAGMGEKKQEMGAHRPPDTVLGELTRGRCRLATLFGDQVVPILVPPWNRIAPQVVAGLPASGFRALSVFGPESVTPDRSIENPPPVLLNTHVDLIDWRGTRGGRDDAVMVADILGAMDAGVRDVGLLTHHLVHDAAAWSFMDRLFALTTGHPACTWRDAATILGERMLSAVPPHKGERTPPDQT